MHPDPAARHALATYSCIGNQVRVRSGHAAGARGVVIGKRGEEGRVIAAFRPAELAAMRPSDEVSVRACGQGCRPDAFPAGLTVLNIDPGLFEILPMVRSPAGADRLSVGVRCSVPSKLVGNGLGRPAVSWDLATSARMPDPGRRRATALANSFAATESKLALASTGPSTISQAVVVHGSSPLPGHGPGVTPILTGPERVLGIRHEAAGHVGLTAARLKLQ